MKALLIRLSQSPIFWNLLNGIVTLTTTELSGIDNIYAILIFGVLNLITKELNSKYNPYYRKQV